MPNLHHQDESKGSVKARTNIKLKCDLGPEILAARRSIKHRNHAEFGWQKRLKVCAPVHDAILTEAPLDKLDHIIEQTKAIIAEASSIILDGFRLNSDAEVIRYADHYMDERGIKMRETVRSI